MTVKIINLMYFSLQSLTFFHESAAKKVTVNKNCFRIHFDTIDRTRYPTGKQRFEVLSG